MSYWPACLVFSPGPDVEKLFHSDLCLVNFTPRHGLQEAQASSEDLWVMHSEHSTLEMTYFYLSVVGEKCIFCISDPRFHRYYC